MRPALRRGRHRDHRAAERNRHRHLLREHPGHQHYRHPDGYRGLGHHEDVQKKVRDDPSERSSPVRASFPGSDAGRHRKVRHCAAGEAHPDVLPEHHRDVRDVHPVRHVRDGFHRDRLGCHRDEACPGWMRRGCFRGEGRRDGVLRDEAHPVWLQSRRDAGREELRASERQLQAWGLPHGFRELGAEPAWEHGVQLRPFRLLLPLVQPPWAHEAQAYEQKAWELRQLQARRPVRVLRVRFQRSWRKPSPWAWGPPSSVRSWRHPMLNRKAFQSARALHALRAVQVRTKKL